MADKLPYCKHVEKHILDCIQGGVAIRPMLSSMQHLTYAPRSLSTMYKTYGDVIERERTKINGAVGKRVIDHALVGDMESKSTQWAAELFLRSKGGWSPTQTNIEVEQDTDPDLDESAANILLSLLGYNENEPTPEEDNG
jgi:hypothetical protein